MADRWNLATSSYAKMAKAEDWGVPVATSVKTHHRFYGADQLDAAVPRGVFPELAHLSMDRQRAIYEGRLDEFGPELEHGLDQLTAKHPGQRLVILCWCRLNAYGEGDCHRRWWAQWMFAKYRLHVPEIGARQKPVPTPIQQQTLFDD